MPQIEGLFMDPYYKLHYPEGATHMDHFPDELREVVHNHWGTFPPQHPLVVDLFGILFFVLTFASFFGNGLVIYVFLATKSLRTPVSICFRLLKPLFATYLQIYLQTNMFVVNLALSDCGIMLTQGPLMFINAFYDNHWMWGPFLCKLYGCTGGIFGNYVYSY